ncbi:hypothetical protein [Desulfitobacterium sp.]|uniref:hypothetical protein n=1 Tax=Desulfitobacterium sp. TaxID=49981 RepID=UPI002C350A54|nr:hypothetical protein [Desulfitobacterium sp.]HVJ49277.1 hypothetical protein [Desulfitobacterium sp.]
MLKKLSIGFLILVLSFALGGCGAPKAADQQQNTQQPNAVTEQAPQSQYLTPVPKDTTLVNANNNVSKQLMSQKDVLGTQIYEQKGITYGDITFKSGVDKTYAHSLANEFLTQLKTNYPGKELTAQALSDGKVIDTISFKP